MSHFATSEVVSTFSWIHILNIHFLIFMYQNLHHLNLHLMWFCWFVLYTRHLLDVCLSWAPPSEVTSVCSLLKGYFCGGQRTAGVECCTDCKASWCDLWFDLNLRALLTLALVWSLGPQTELLYLTSLEWERVLVLLLSPPTRKISSALAAICSSYSTS